MSTFSIKDYIIDDVKSQALITNTLTRLQYKIYTEPYLIEALRKLDKSENVISNVINCGEQLILKDNGDVKNGMLCKNRYCIFCAYKKSRKTYGDTMAMVNYLSPEDLNYLFLTVTLKNVRGPNLSGQIDNLNNSFRRFYQSAIVKRFSRGMVKQLEITYNESKDTYHAHIHAIIAADKDYFSNSNKYVSQAELKKLWERSARISYSSQVRIEKVHAREGCPIEKAVAEVSKYCTKLSNIYSLADKHKCIDVIYTMLKATEHRRLHTLSGVFKQAMLKLSIKDDEDEQYGAAEIFRYDRKRGNFYTICRQNYENLSQQT